MYTYKTILVDDAFFSRKARRFGDDDIIIAFMGPTGSGKSQIIDTLTGQQGQRAKDSLKSVTKDLEASRILDHDRYGSRIVLIDTPGFDDSSRSDEQILKLIGEWLKKTCQKRILLSGIVSR
ncbi:hypothetical protein M413DRAFT_115376 [Hebeloma cylindrosporum]|uniref:G domain-containing protein n=1 Tax=Hebeloma cylindrosporum TaxID=76867 RepID=A0A0C2Z9A7_HEBCY|nr:hypothetical protein M413DRAFT_115376 [Hebeloma cylindrosporum h7]